MTRLQALTWAHDQPRASMELAGAMIVEGQGAVSETTGGETVAMTTAALTVTMTAEDVDTRAVTMTAGAHVTTVATPTPAIATMIGGEEAEAASATTIGAGATEVIPAGTMKEGEAMTIVAPEEVTIVTMAAAAMPMLRDLLLLTTDDATKMLSPVKI
mmetsp:Transcript_15422/g.51770  ORF Transcript_15422/g.51770 Transcript_15422/m.51770 type:complete len:158 (-) Transcript_15422:199-672(-)